MAERERTLQDQLNSAMEELKQYIIDNPDETDDNYSDFIYELAEQSMVTYTYDALVIAGNTLWLATVRPDDYYNDDATAFDIINENIRQHVSEELHSALDELRDELTPECDDCGTRFKRDDLLVHLDGNWYCADCYQLNPEDSEVILPS